jgi:GDP-4-dehydro-6-deoxy-D-mannose reductase
MVKVLLTGANGFLGKALCNKLEGKYDLILLDRSKGDITNPSIFTNIENVDHVFHLAARTFVPDSWNETPEFLQSNLIGTTNVLEFCKRSKASLTFVSSYVYGKPENLPILENARIKPNNPYALSKFLCEQVCEFYSDYHNIDICVIRPFNIFGPGQSVQFLIPKIINLIKSRQAIELFDLSPKRDYIFIDDVVDALAKTLELRLPGYNVFNIGSGKSLSVKEVVDCIQTISGTTLEVISKEKYRKEELDNVFADISNSLLKLNWMPQTEFHAGIKKIIHG